MTETVLQTRNLTKEFTRLRGLSSPRHYFDKKIFTAVKDVSLTVERGEIFGLLGPNGAGKTTLTKMLCTLIVPTSGSATICGYDLARQGSRIKSRIALISSEERSFYWRLSGRRNLDFFASLYGLSREESQRRISEVLEIVGMTEAAGRRFQEYSTGMKQRMALARGLLSDPDVFFMDEPTKGLDPVAVKDLHKLIRERLTTSGKTVILATHHLAEAEEVCDRIGIMYAGKMIAYGAVADLAGDDSLADFFHALMADSATEQ